MTVNENDRQTLIFRDNALQSLTIKKYESGTNHPLSGVVFLVTDSTGARIGEYTTDANGEITIPGLTPGTVLVVREIRTVNGYVLNGTPQTITIGGGTSTLVPGAAFGTVADTGNVLTFYDEPLSTLVIHKYAAGTERTPLSGVEFRLTDGSGAAVGNGTYYTNRSGEIRVENLEPGTTVTVRETKTVSDYVLDGTPQTVKIPSGDVLEMVFWNARKQALTVQKYVRNTTTPIPGTAFLITDSIGAPVGPSNGEYVTDENGQIVLSDLTPGVTITVKEIRAAEGYALDAAPKSILIQSGATQTLQFYNSPTGTLMITKRDKTTEKPLKGAVFQILTADGNYVPNAGGQLSSNGLYTTDSKGQILLTGLSAETLVVRETKAPEGYLLDDAPQTVRVSPGSTQSLTFYDTPEQALTIQKYIDGTTKPIAGVTFLITDSSGAVVGSSNGEYQTDRNGRIVLTGLIPGTTVTAKETKTVPGYVLDTTPQSILIKEGAAQTLTFYNQASGGLELIKADAADKTIRIPYTTFEIRKLDGALVKTITTGRDGRIYTDLEAGDYALVEIEAANGYKLDPTPEYFTVRNGKTTTVTVTNTAVSGILLHKIDASTGKPIYGVTFLLYNAGNTPIGQYSTDNQGYIRIEGLEAGVYFLRELENKGYVPDTQMKTVYVKSGETTLIEWKNIPVTAQIQITKRSADYNPTNGLPAMTLLEGAVFEIRDKAGNLMDTVQSNRSGLALTKPLPLGRYTIRETKAPAYYGINETEWTAYLEHEGQIVRFEITDKSLVTGVSMTKTGPKQVMSGQPVIYRFSGIGNTSNVRLENFYWRDKVPAQVRLQSVVTGTYNFPGSYKITYRVNGGEPRTLADNLSTQKNYTLAASPAALKLASNEQVTEIMFVFGQVPAGFAQVEAPSLNCTAVSNIQASSFVNEADVGGTYNSQWIQSVSRWVTSVYKAPTKLPRTGY